MNNLKDSSITKIFHKSKSQLTIIDWVLFGLIAVCSFFLFNHIDLLITAQHSYAYLNGNIFNFYEACQEMNDTYSANYLPITFVIFAIWNLPLKILGMAPTFWGDWSTIFVFWNKLLPVSVYILSAYVLYKLCHEEFGIDCKKSKLIMYIFLTAPVGFFSQFMFCQYDIFTVFFMLLGLRYYYKREQSKGNWLKFVLCFGLAVSFKYYAVLVFIVLLFLKIKNIWKIIASCIVVALPCFVQFLFYFLADKAAFIEAVFGFGVLEYMDVSSINIGFASIKLLPLFICFIAACAYFTMPKNRNEEISYGIYYSCGMFFALFSFMTWHPQWLLIAVPFWVLGVCLNKKYEILLWLDVLFFVVFIVFVVNAFEFGVDQSLLKNGIFASALQFSADVKKTMADLFVYKDTDMLFSILVVLFAVSFVFNHPRFHMIDFSEKMERISFVLKVRFVFCILLFVVPAMSLLPEMLHTPEQLWSQYEMKDIKEVAVNTRETVVQYATISGDSITDVYIRTRVPDDALLDRQGLILEIRDIDNDELVAESEIAGKKISKDGLSHFKVENCITTPGKQYKFVFRSEIGYLSPVYIYYGTGKQTESVLYNTVLRDYSNDYIVINEREYLSDGYHLIYQILGHYRK